MARTLVAELERELRGVESGLRILATSEELQQGKLGAFHRRLQDALQLQNVDGYVLLDNHDMLVANSAPYPSPRSEASCRTRSGSRPDRRRASSRTCSTPPCA